ncbi:MAG TPA: branched-chain amino acid ABC transporter permease [Candidatus Sulfotelmatobacter sp.]|nr:branched-chain amino acid ABC transporter permease [Candidatus Sulfotelmatobacter sp.]
MTFWVVQALNGVSFGMLLFLLAAGLSLIFGVMKVLNLAHGSFYLLGAYLGLTVLRLTHSFLLALAAAALGVAALALLLERTVLRRIYGEELRQALLTFGVLFIIADQALWIWGGNPQTLPKPAGFTASVRLGDVIFPSYRLLVIAVGVVMGAALWWLQERTRVGAVIRAGVDDEEMARGIGVNTPLLFTAVFALGAFLAGFGGVMGGALLGVYPGADFEVLLLAFVVIIIGGLGSLKGAFVGGLLVGLIDNFGKAFFPELALFTVFAPMAAILAVRPTGLFGKA